jgi:cytoskeletal protein CcmA (bactofilin family)
MVRVDEMVACRNIRCRKRFELTGQSVVLTSEGSAQQPGPNFDPENFGNR